MKNTIEKTKEEIRKDFIIPTPNRLQLVLKIQGRPVETDCPELHEDFEPVFELWTNGSVYYWKYGNQKLGRENYFTEQEVRELLTEANFTIEWIKYVGLSGRPGEIVGKDEGVMFVKAVNPAYN